VARWAPVRRGSCALAERRDLDGAVGRAVLSSPRSQPDMPGASESRATIWASSSWAPSTKRCSTTAARRRGGQAPRVTCSAVRSSARPRDRSTRLNRSPYIVRRARSLVDQASPERILELKVVDPAMGSGAFLVAACEIAPSVGCRSSAPADAWRSGPSERASIRQVAERCLFGVDLNPAVQLGRLSSGC
jgi:hypothetical protein